jgi:SAM-dependent methyltransferase
MSDDDPKPPPGIDTSHPSVARAYDHLLGGKLNYPVDREFAEKFLKIWPEVRDNAFVIRGFAMRVTRYLVEEAGVRQILDIGSGLPTQDNVHQVAQRIAPDTKVMYVDNDPIVLAHGRALLVKDKRTGYIEADVRDTELVLRRAAKLLDFEQPVAVMCSALLHWVKDNPTELMAEYIDALPPGSYLAASHNCPDGVPAKLIADMYPIFPSGWYPRPRAQIEEIFQGRELVAPGLVTIEGWRPDQGVQHKPLQLPLLGAVARL